MNEREIILTSRRIMFWAFGLFCIQILAVTALSFFVITDKDIYYPHSLVNSLDYLEYFYDDEINRTELIHQAREAIFSELDRYSGYIEPNRMEMVVEEFTGAYSGIGITVFPVETGLSVMSVREDGPAGRAGIHTGDVIIKIDSTDLGNGASYSTISLLRGKEGSTVTVSVFRYNIADTLDFELTRQKLDLIHIPYAGLTVNDNLYIRIIDFESGMTYQLLDILDSLYNPNKEIIGGIILDLRGNPGGLLNEAIETANLFLDKDHLIVGTKGRSIWSDRTFYSSGKDKTEGTPIAILVDGGSASSAEILSGALRFNNRAILVGDTTFGKGLVQQYSGYADGSGIRLTTSRYFFEGGIFLNDTASEVIDSADGLAPDYYIASESSERFPRELENSLLLREFALHNVEELTRYEPMSHNADDIYGRFIEYALDSGFVYQSEMTILTDLASEMARYSNYLDETIRAIEKLHKLSVQTDRKVYDKYKDYITTRLYQIALEIKSGIPESYRLAIVPYRHDIIMAERIIAGELDNDDKQ